MFILKFISYVVGHCFAHAEFAHLHTCRGDGSVQLEEVIFEFEPIIVPSAVRTFLCK